MTNQAQQKAILFFLVLALFFIVAGVDVLHPRILRLGLAYGIIGGFAFWGGGEPVGVLRPVSLRPLYVGLGAAAMTVLFILMLVVKLSLPPRLDILP